jgi:hypothetical protein
MNPLRLALVAAAILSAASTPMHAHAKELAHRLGVGFADQFGLTNSMPALAVRYYPATDFGVMGLMGVDTQKDNSRFGFMAKAFKVIFKEENLNFYLGAGAGIVSQQNSGNNDSGFVIDGYVGTEWFFTGLENLGFAFEAGVGVTSISSQVRFRTMGDAPFRAGIIFYF